MSIIAKITRKTALLCLFVSFSSLATPRAIPNAPTIAAKGYLLVDYDSGEVLAGKDQDVPIPPASLTKMMTSYVIGQEIKAGNISLDDQVVISEKAWSKNFPDSSKMFIEVGKTVSVADLNRGIIIQSGNDACVAMAEHIAGSEEAFADLMNTWAKQLGMTNSHFENSHGLHSETHNTSPMDMAILAKALIRDVPEEYAIYKEQSFSFNNITQYNRNSLLWDKSLNVDGIKTGHTSDAGYSLVSSATKDGMRLIAVVMGTSSEQARKEESKKLLNWGFRFFETLTPYNAGDKLASERIWMGDKEYVDLGVIESTPITIPRGSAKNLKANFVLDTELAAPIAKGQVVGKVFYEVDNETLAEFPLVALNDINEGSWFSRLMDYFQLLFKRWFG
ncbi:serine hydrolase [Motilimonas cestriensis]|uniref:serine hydrolase n=1 Tax=Motilimonas cestriensis TaxID=2742685 RepID=UPI003DA1FA3C